jgi:hypothetical protein
MSFWRRYGVRSGDGVRGRDSLLAPALSEPFRIMLSLELGDCGHREEQAVVMVHEAREPILFVERPCGIVLRVHHDRHGADLPADGQATQQCVHEQQSPESLPAVAPVHGESPDQDRRHGLVAWQPPSRRSR